MQLIDAKVNLATYPSETYAPGAAITLGDLHGNALKLLYFLTAFKILKFTSKQYDALFRIYCKSPQVLTAADLQQFDDIVTQAPTSAQTSNILVRLLGDDLGDRGSNDYFTLRIYAKLVAEGIPLTIIFSNHAAEAILNYRRNDRNYYAKFLSNASQFRSLINLGIIVDRGLITEKVVNDLFKKSYLPHIKLYDCNADGTLIFMHTTQNLSQLQKIASLLGINDKVYNLTDFTKLIKKINRNFSQLLKNSNNDFEQLYHDQSALFDAVWSRNIELDQQSRNLLPFHIIHGHVGTGDTPEPFINLDTDLGKTFVYDYANPYQESHLNKPAQFDNKAMDLAHTGELKVLVET